MDKNMLKLEDKIEHNEKLIEKNAKTIEKILEKIENNSNRIQENSIALDILKDYKMGNKRKFIVIVILCIIIAMLSGIIMAHHLR